MIRRAASMTSSAPGATPATNIKGWILGWGVDKTNTPFVIWEDSGTSYINQFPIGPNEFAVLDGQPDPLPEIA